MHPRAPLAAALDTAIVVAFVAIGRRNHDEGEALAGIAETAAPFLLALVTAWLLLKVNGERVFAQPTRIGTGVVIWSYTLVFGMFLRRFMFDGGTALPFVIVACIFLGLLVGWRVVANAIWNRRTTAL